MKKILLGVTVAVICVCFWTSAAYLSAQNKASIQTEFDDIYRDNESGYSIQLPKYWIETDDTYDYIDGETQRKAFLYNRLDDITGLPRYISITHGKKSAFFRNIAPYMSSFSDEDLINFYIYKKERSYLRFRFIASKKISHDGLEGYEVEIEYKQLQGRMFREINQFFIKKDSMYVFEAGFTLNNAAQRQVVTDMLQSVDFLDRVE